MALLPEQRKPGWVLVAATIVVLGKFYAHELVLGQANLIFATVVTSAVLAIKSGREALAGLLVALAIVVKPYGVLLLPWLAARRHPRSIVSAGAGVAAALLLPALLYGLDGNVVLHREWLRTVVDTTAPNLLNVDNTSWPAMFARWFGPGGAASALAIATSLAAAGVVAWVWRAGRYVPQSEGLEVGLLLILMPLISPQGWDYVLLVSTPAVVYLANYGDRLPGALRPLTFVSLAVVGLTIFDLVGRTAYRAFMRGSGITLCFFVVIAALVALRRKQIA